MRSRRHRNQVHRRINSASTADCKDPRKPLLEILAEHPRIEIDVLAANFFSEDFAGDNIARRQLGQAMPLEHEPLSILVQ